MKNSPSQTKNLQQKDGRLVCPACRELLARQDVESFFRCPYCNYKFLLNDEMEDYLLTPVVENWCQMNLAQQSQQFSSDSENGRSNWI